MSGIVYIISAPSGSGKSTLVKELRRQFPDLEFSVSYTTRSPRGSERDGTEYFFVSRGLFEEMIAQDKFLEHAEVFGNYYGTAKRFLHEAESRGHDLILDIDVQGQLQVQKRLPEAISIFILPPAPEALERRLKDRSVAEKMVDEKIIRRRLETAKNEIVKYTNYSYILVNDRLPEAVEELKAIVLAERYKQAGAIPPEAAPWLEIAEKCLQRNSKERIDAVLESFSISPAQA